MNMSINHGYLKNVSPNPTENMSLVCLINNNKRILKWRCLALQNEREKTLME